MFERVRAVEQKLGVDERAAQGCVDLVEVRMAGLELVGEQVGERNYLRNRVLRERSCDVGAAVSTAEQAMADRRVALVSEGCCGLEKKEAGGEPGRGLYEFPALHGVAFQIEVLRDLIAAWPQPRTSRRIRSK